MTTVPTFAASSGFLTATGTDRDASYVVAGVPLDTGTINRR